jgi:hypothetical protein
MEPAPSLVSRMSGIAFGASDENPPQLATSRSDSDNFPPAFSERSLPSTSSFAQCQIPEWYIEPRTKDWGESGLGTVSPSEIGVPPSKSLTQIGSWELDDHQYQEFQKRPHAIVKDSWLTKSHRSEGEMFEAVKGSFGVPSILGSQFIPMRDDTPCAKPWPLWVREPAPIAIEQRCLV